MANWKSRAVPVTEQEAPKSSWKDRATAVQPEVSELASAGRGAAQGLSFGLRDEAAGALESPMGALKEIANKFGADYADEAIEAYRKERDESRRLDEEAKKANPASYTAGEIGGAVATSFIPGLGAARGASLAKTAGQAALQGAAYGVGASEGENVGEIARDAAVSGAMGGLGGAAGYGAGKLLEKGAEKVGKFIGKADDVLTDAADAEYARALGATKADFQRGTAKPLGRAAREEGIITPFASKDTMLSRAEALKKAGGEKMGGVYNQIDEAGASTFNPLDTAVKVEQELNPTYRTPINRSEWGQLENTLESILQRGDGNVSMAEAQALKKEIGAVAFPKGKAPLDPTPKQQMAMDAYRVINQQIDEAAQAGSEKLGIEGLKDTLARGKEMYGTGRQAEKLLSSKIAGEEAGGGLRKAIGAATDLPHAIVSPKTFAVKKAVEKGYDAVASRGHQLTGITADKLAGIAAKAPERLGKFAGPLRSAAQRGSQSVAATHFMLQQTNPEYRQYIKEIEQSQGNEDEQE